ncbi:MAG: ABC transporter permease [Planctomycetota bacterium]
MRRFFVLFGRELKATFDSFGFFLLLAIVMGITGFTFQNLLQGTGGEMDFALRGLQSWLFWLTIVLTPLLTMRLFAEEKRSGSFELLMTAPVSDAQVVLAKYFSSALIFATFMLPLWVLHALLALFFDAEPDWGQLCATSIGLLGLAIVFLAVGLFASAVSSQQLWAGILALIGNMVLMALGTLQSFFDAGSTFSRFFRYINLSEHLGTALGGVIDFRQTLVQVSLTCLILFWTIRSVEVRKWR